MAFEELVFAFDFYVNRIWSLKILLKKVMLELILIMKKYNTISKLSLTVAADIKSPGTSNAEETATKFTPLPI